MAVSMAAFTTNGSITKVVSSQMNFGQVILPRAHPSPRTGGRIIRPAARRVV